MNLLLSLIFVSLAQNENLVLSTATFGLDPNTGLSFIAKDKKARNNTLKVYKALSIVWTSDDFERRLGWMENEIFRGITCKLNGDNNRATLPICQVSDVVPEENSKENELVLSESVSNLLKSRIKKSVPYILCPEDQLHCIVTPAQINKKYLSLQ